MNEMTYEEAMQKLQDIIEALQNDELPIDDLIDQTTEAKKLVVYCQQKLRSIEETLEKMEGA